MIYFKGGDKFRTLYTLMKHYLNYYNPTTYSDPECTVQQCYSFRRRSFEALLELARTYFPETTDEELIKTISRVSDFFIKKGKKRVWIHYCQTVGAVVVWRGYHDYNHYPLISNYNYGPNYKLMQWRVRKPGRKSLHQLKELLNE